MANISKNAIIALAWVAIGLTGIGLVMVGADWARIHSTIQLLTILTFMFYGLLIWFMVWNISINPMLFMGLVLIGIGLAIGLLEAIFVSVSKESI